jgi:O-antigen/teichoic acid export membrane protein
MNEVSPPPRAASPLASVARGAILWGGGSNLLHDLLQFTTMLALVRLLTAEDYGRAALAQTALILISVVSFKTFAPHSLQLRDPNTIDWQSHFTAAAAINLFAFALTLAVAGILSERERYAEAALPLAVLSVLLLIEIPATLRQYMVQAAFEWGRFRALTTIGAFLASIAAIAIAALGGGVWALVVPAFLLGLPAVVDLFLLAKWRPNWSWSWQKYRETLRFGINRMGSAGLIAGRQIVEQMALAGFYDFAVLGLFTRSVGLATMSAGRIGAVVVLSLYPVITRADPRSDRFRRIAGLVLRGVAWMTIPAAVFLALAAPDMVGLLYGPKWTGVTPLLPFAATQVALGGLAATANELLVAHDDVQVCFKIDILSAVVGVALVFWMLPQGPQLYLCALTVQSALVLTVTLIALHATKGIDIAAVRAAFVPPTVAGLTAGATLAALQPATNLIDVTVARVGIDALVFAAAFLLVIRLGFAGPLRELLHVAPGGRQLASVMHLSIDDQ